MRLSLLTTFGGTHRSFLVCLDAGWTWGYGATLVHDIETSFNHIHHIGLGFLSDMGCVYTLGHQPGSRIANNFCHDVQSYNYGGWACSYQYICSSTARSRRP